MPYKFIKKAAKKVKIKVYARRIFPGQSPQNQQLSFMTDVKRKGYFNASVTIPREAVRRGARRSADYLRRNRAQLIGGSALSVGGGYFGTKLANRKKRRRR